MITTRMIAKEAPAVRPLTKGLTTHGMPAGKQGGTPADRPRGLVISSCDLDNGGRVTDAGRARIEARNSEAYRKGQGRRRRYYRGELVGSKP